MSNVFKTKPTMIALSLILFACLMRLSLPPMFPHLANFSPLGAIALFAGILFRRPGIACLFTILCVVISDFVVNSLMYHQFSVLYPGFFWQYLSYLLVSMLGFTLRDQLKALTLAYAGVGSSFIFYIISNFGVWLQSGLYPKNWEGLIACYVAAIPFFQNTLASNLVYMTMLYAACNLKRSFEQKTLTR